MLLLGAVCAAQNTRDTIRENLDKSENSSEKLKLYKKYAEFFETKDFERSIKLSHEGWKLAKKTKQKTLEADFLRHRGNAYYFSGKLDSAGTFYFRALHILKTQKAPQELAELYNNLGRFYRKTRDYQRALRNYDLAQDLYTQLNDLEGIATIYNESGVVYEYLEKHAEAVNRYQKSLQIQRKRGDLVGQGYSLEFIGGNYILQKKFSLAEKYLLASIKVRKQTNDDFALALSYNVLGKLYLEQKRYNEAEIYLLKSNEISRRLNYLDLLKENYDNLSKIYRIQGKNDQAYASLENFRIINDSIFTLGKAEQIEELSVKYETAEKDRLLLAEKSKVLKRNVLLFALLGILLLGFFYYQNFRTRQKVQLQRAILHQQELAANAVMRAEDNERKRMAAQLHDGIGQLLSAANMNLNFLSELKKDESHFSTVLRKTQSVLADAISDVRTLSHQIMPNMLIRNSLPDALQDLVAKTSSPNLMIELNIEGLRKDLNQTLQVVLFRVIQECLNNTIKHAHASKVQITLTQNDGFVDVLYTDNGVGFNVEKAIAAGGLGVENIRSRIEMLKGTYTLQSEKHHGTKVQMKIPC